MANLATIAYSNTSWGNESEKFNQNFNALNTELGTKITSVAGSGLILDSLNTALTNRSWIAVGTIASVPTTSTSTYTFNGTSYTAYAGTIVRLTTNNYLYVCTSVSGSTYTWVAIQTDLSAYATQTWVTQQITTATAGMATQAWVNTQLANYSTTTQMNTAIANATADMATKTWVTSQLGSYLTTTAAANTYATKASTLQMGTRNSGSIATTQAMTSVTNTIELSTVYSVTRYITGTGPYCGIKFTGPTTSGWLAEREWQVFLPIMDNSSSVIFRIFGWTQDNMTETWLDGSLLTTGVTESWRDITVNTQASSGTGGICGILELNLRGIYASSSTSPGSLVTLLIRTIQ